MSLLLPLLITAATQPALAWKHTYTVWDSNDFPVQWYMSDHVTSQLDAAYQVEVQQTSVQNWPDDAPCAGLAQEYMGVREGHWASGTAQDDVNTIYYDDPALQNPETALGVTYIYPGGDYAFSLRDVEGDDQTYNYAVDNDIVYSEWVKWTSTADIDAGNCAGSEFAIEATSTHEWGHFWGMGHSCEEEDVQAGECDSLDLFDATMFWTGNPCDISRTTLNEDDIEGITALYGPYAFFSAAEETATSGGVPLEVCFELETKGGETEGLEVEWNFGDGEKSTDYSPCHTYEEKGQFTVFIDVTGTDAECGDYSFTFREPAYVLACEAPQPAEGFTGLFTYEYFEDATYQMINQADTSVYGCVNRVQWDVFKGEELVQSVNAWSPKIDFGEAGTYDVVLNLSGPGGVYAETLEIDVGSEAGCSSVPAAAGLLGMLIGLGGALRRRRES